MASVTNTTGNHLESRRLFLERHQRGEGSTSFIYTFENFFHPFIGELIGKLNQGSLSDLMAAQFEPPQEFFKDYYDPYPKTPTEDQQVQVKYSPKEIDVGHGPYANYNWELFFHIPLAVAVHLSKNQRFAEAQRWFHYIFDPTSNDKTGDPRQRFWKFLAFRKADQLRIEDIVRLLSIPDDKNNKAQQAVLEGYAKILATPFQPHAVARTRPLAYQYSVVMKYLDNLIAWGDHLFQQDTIESLNEAMQIYILAANILGERPQRIPSRGQVRAKTFAQLKKTGGLGAISNALVELEGQFPFNVTLPSSTLDGQGQAGSNALFGIGRTLYFGIPRNEKLLAYWDTVGDRLFKIRHCINIAGVVRPLALFDPPLDPGMLVKAAAAGIDIGSIVSGLNRPIGPVRGLVLIQKALELCGEVRALGNALLSALEKRDAEHLALVRQGHEEHIQQMTQEVRFLQLKQAQESTRSLLTSRKTALERLHYYQRLLGLPADQNAPDELALDQIVNPDDASKLNQENFDEAYDKLVGQYDKALTLQKLTALKLVGGTSAANQSGAAGQGKLFLNSNEDAELNTHLPTARDTGLSASVANSIASAFLPVPDLKTNLHYWGIGATSDIKIGTVLYAGAKTIGEISQIISSWERDQAGIASRTASYERRADEWLFQYNLAAHEIMQIGRQILTSLIAEQIAHHEYLTIKQHVANANEIKTFLQDKFTNEDLYFWMQGEIARLYYEYYRLAFDTGRKAEKTMKQELMRPEVDAQDFVKFNYWDGGRKGLLSGEALYLDVKRLEVAYHEHNKRELELTKHVSLRQLNPMALLALKANGTCQVTIPEWLYDLDCPGHYLRRIKTVALSMPSVVGPYTSVNCTVSLLRSSIRKSPVGDYARQPQEDDRFVDYTGAVQSIVTSSGQNDSGMFETNLRDERFLPFEGAGAESTWKLDLPEPKHYPAFDYATISDVILHIRYTSRQGIAPDKVKGALKDLLAEATQSDLALLFSLRHDFPTEWSLFVNATTEEFTAIIRREYFPYFTQGQAVTISGLELYDGATVSKHHPVGNAADATADLGNPAKLAFTVSAPVDQNGPRQVLTRKAKEVFLIIRYTLGS